MDTSIIQHGWMGLTMKNVYINARIKYKLNNMTQS